MTEAHASTTWGEAGRDMSDAPWRFAEPERSFHGWGVARRVDIPAPWTDHLDAVTAALAAITRDGPDEEPGMGPIAMLALPFNREDSATAWIPAVVQGWSATAGTWHTRVTPADQPPSPPPTLIRTDADTDRATATIGGLAGQAAGHATTAAGDPEPVVVPELSAEDWMAHVATLTDLIRAGRFTKAVLARRVDVTATSPVDPIDIAERLHARHPHALRFLIDGFVGASPELLVGRTGTLVRAQPMAGTTARSGDPVVDQQRADELLHSTKNRMEHQITIDMVHATLLPWCSYLDAEPMPTVAAAGSVQHLATLVEGRLSDPTPSVLELVAALHPTPAVGGWPRQPALEALAALEPSPRGRYAGPVGWVDAAGNGTFAVGIRSAEIVGNRVVVQAGVGVVADSDPESELAETEAKLAATLPTVIGRHAATSSP